MWYGLKINGDLKMVIFWTLDRPPATFDFNVLMFGDFEYEIVRVIVAELS